MNEVSHTIRFLRTFIPESSGSLPKVVSALVMLGGNVRGHGGGSGQGLGEDSRECRGLYEAGGRHHRKTRRNGTAIDRRDEALWSGHGGGKQAALEERGFVTKYGLRLTWNATKTKVFMFVFGGEHARAMG